ncbi:MAG: hypothetical protein EOO07_14165, partial [Chitinophagaceae bacterium]
MLLRIIDNRTSNEENKDIHIIFEHEGKKDDFFVDSYSSPVTESFSNLLSWYFGLYLQEHEKKDGSEVVEKLIKYGQYVGDELLGEDHQLIKFKEIIEGVGYHNLKVQIESPDVYFFSDLWEIAILHNSKYVLSSAVNSFVRQFSGADFSKDYAELEYGLHIPPVSPEIPAFLNGQATTATEPAKNNHQPLRVLYLTSRPASIELPFSSSNSINIDLDSISKKHPIEYELREAVTWEQLQNRLEDSNKPIHIFHYDGPVVIVDGSPSILLCDTSGNEVVVDAVSLSKVLTENRVGLLSIDARLYLDGNKIFPAHLGLAMVAKSAQRNNLGNVIGLGFITDPWTSSECFKSLYREITKGLSLEQAVVETRKVQQKNTESVLMTASPIPFQCWPLLVHYSKQTVNFFVSAPSHSNGETSQDMTANRKLYGFRSEMLPPLLNQVSDNKALMLINAVQNTQLDESATLVSITGLSGSGKSQLAHIAGFYFAAKDWVDYSFYFDFSSESFLSTDILDMVAPILDVNPGQYEEVEEKLTRIKCCFVFDNLLQSHITQQNDASLHNELHNLISRLVEKRHIVILVSELSQNIQESAGIKIQTSPMNLIEQKIISSSVLRQYDLADVSKIEGFNQLLGTLEGNPWLIKKTIPLLKFTNSRELRIEVDQHINASARNSKIEQFYEWQWGKLPYVWQQMLVLCADVKGLLLEMIVAAVDQKDLFEPARNLLALFDGDATSKLVDGLNSWESAGFISRFPHGRMVD